MRRKVTADKWSGDARCAEDRAEDALIAPALARCDDVSDDRLRCHHQPTASESLYGAEQNQLRHAPAHPTKRRAQQEEYDAGLKDALAPVDVAQLTVKRRDNRLSQQVCGDDPGEVSEAA